MSNISLTPTATPARAGFSLEGCTYLAIRPIVTISHYTASAPVAEYDRVQLLFGVPGTPAQTLDVYETAEAAITAALSVKAGYPHLRLWYDGHDDAFEFANWRSLSASFAEWNEDWQVVEQVAAGHLTSDAPVVLEAATYIPLIAVAAAQVQP